MSPSQTLSTKPVPGRKKDKTRITVLLGVNAIGTDKLKPWVIGNSKRPRPLSRVNLEHLPVYYRGNPKAWMNSSIFEEVLREIDNRFRAQDKKILLLVDNAPSHFNPHYSPPVEVDQDDDHDNDDDELPTFGKFFFFFFFSFFLNMLINIIFIGNQASRGRGGHNGRSRGRGGHNGGSRGRSRSGRGGSGHGHHGRSEGRQSDISRLQLTHVKVVFLPPNTTSHLQPLDAGVIASFKNHFKRKYCRHMLDLFEDGKDINSEKINIKEAINYVAESWGCVTEETVLNCWKKTGILPSLSDEDRDNALQTQQEKLNEEITNIDQMIEELDMDDPSASSLAGALTNFFQELEEIPTEDILSEDDIIRLIQEETCDQDIDSEEEEVLVSSGDALKSLKTWISFFEQQYTDEFHIEDLNLFKKYFKIVKRLEQQSRKQASITDFFSF